ncbi:phosphate-starvation-inducible protein PsiE [Psychrobacter sp. CAM01]|uniref:phosphate-starvation-inducible protein PsiE n=1 Tax=Psychrobacter sp. CAM01 TaxID=3080335 RepID=UPI00397E7AC7
MMGIHERLQYIGREFVDICHYIILFLISVVVVWTAGKEFLVIFQKGSADLKDILLLFIYLELLAMIGIYFKTHRLPVQFLIFIAITALSRHLVVDVQAVSDNFHLWLLATISFAIMVLSASIVILTWTAKMFGRPEDYLDDHQSISPEHHLPSYSVKSVKRRDD